MYLVYNFVVKSILSKEENFLTFIKFEKERFQWLVPLEKVSNER